MWMANLATSLVLAVGTISKPSQTTIYDVSCVVVFLVVSHLSFCWIKDMFKELTDDTTE